MSVDDPMQGDKNAHNNYDAGPKKLASLRGQGCAPMGDRIVHYIIYWDIVSGIRIILLQF